MTRIAFLPLVLGSLAIYGCGGEQTSQSTEPAKHPAAKTDSSAAAAASPAPTAGRKVSTLLSR